MSERMINGKKISQKELELRYNRAQALGKFACFDECRTYPFCERLGNFEIFDRLMMIKYVSEKAAKDILVTQGFGDEEFDVTVRIYCTEYKRPGIDLGI